MKPGDLLIANIAQYGRDAGNPNSAGWTLIDGKTRDDKRGIVSEGAMLVLRRGQRTLFLTSPALPQRDRAAALQSLEALGRIAAKRLD